MDLGSMKCLRHRLAHLTKPGRLHYFQMQQAVLFNFVLNSLHSHTLYTYTM